MPNTVYQLEIDVAHDCTIGELLSFMESYGASIAKYQAIGPAGGNPLITFTFTDLPSKLMFESAYRAGLANPVSIVESDLPHEIEPGEIEPIDELTGGYEDHLEDVNEDDLPEYGEGRGMEPTKSQKDQPE